MHWGMLHESLFAVFHRACVDFRRSYVPDHVRHPEKYICYTLDEPLIVGSGRDGTHGGGPQQPQKVTPSQKPIFANP